jgi:hypothetical protein
MSDTFLRMCHDFETCVLCLDGNIELALANMDLNEPMLEPVTFDEDNEEPLDESSSTPTNGATKLGLGIEDEDGGQENGSDVDYDMEEDY